LSKSRTAWIASRFRVRSVAKSGICRIDKRVLEMYNEGLDRSNVFRALKEDCRFSTSASGKAAAAGELGKMTRR
jgi:hypothetical protein